MSEHNGDGQGLALEALKKLLTGESLQDVRNEHGRLTTTLQTILERLNRLESFDREIVRGVLKELLNTGARQQLALLDAMAHDETPQHCNNPLLLAALRVRIPVWIWGDAGSGKTTAAAKAAEALKLPFRFISVCPTTTKSEFLGYRDAGGVYHSTAFREIFESGGVFLIDEMDNGNPSILSVLNSALANEYCAFPDGNIKRHEETLFVAAANTIGRGADVRYIGRNALDATTLDRFVFVRMDIDENLENALAGGQYSSTKLADLAHGGEVTPDEWLKYVRMVRRACTELGIEHIVSPRATIYGQRLIQAGVGKSHLFEMCLWKGLRETDRSKILEFIKDLQRR